MSNRAAIVLHRSDIKRLVNAEKPLRDQLIIDLPRRMGLRSKEIATFRWENVDYDRGVARVLDSKRHELLSVPLDWKVAELLSQYNQGRTKGYVIRALPHARRKPGKNRPFSVESLERIVKTHAQKLDVQNWHEYTTRLLRCYFAAEWIRESYRRSGRVNLKVLQAIMRHKWIETTWHYVNRIYHNNFVNNRQHVSIPGSGYASFWDDGYPSGGNYWSDYSGVDVKSGPYQNETGSDGIGDTPYIIDAENQDRYPLMHPWMPLEGDVNFDRIVDIYDIIIWSDAFHSQPGYPNWNPNVDLNQDEIIDIFDAVIISVNYGKTHP